MVNQKHVFWEALILAVFIFASGILLGYFIELNRTSNIITAYQESELNLLDVQLQQKIISQGDFDCDLASSEMIDFADRIFKEVSILEKYEDSARLSDGIVFQHKKYDLLRAILWSNSLIVKEKCNSGFHTIVYFFEYNSDDPILVVKQRSFSKFLEEIKDKKGSSVVLIPIAGNLNIGSIEFLKSNYGVDSLPAVLVDEKVVATDIEELTNIEDYL